MVSEIFDEIGRLIGQCQDGNVYLPATDKKIATVGENGTLYDLKGKFL